MIYWQYTLFNLLSRCSQSIPLVLVFFSFFRLRKKILRQNFFFLFSIILIGVTDRILFDRTGGVESGGEELYIGKHVRSF